MSDPTQNPPPEGGSYQPPPPPGEASRGPAGPYDDPAGQRGPYPPAPGAGYGPAPTGIGQPADLMTRFLARLIDLLILGVVNFVLVGLLVVGALAGGSAGLGYAGGGFASSALYALLTSAISLGYFTVLESRTGRTIGKMALKVQTQGPDGGPPSVEMALKRNAFMAIGVLGIVPVLGFLAPFLSLAAYISIAVTINSSPTRQGWHDRFAGGTQVTKTG